MYSNVQKLPIKPERIIVEDSNVGYEFFKAVSDDNDIICESARGKSNLFSALNDVGEKEVCVIADGAAIGSEMNRLYNQAMRRKNIHLYLPESFGWIILDSKLIDGREITQILEKPENYIDSREFFSWERYFTKLMTSITEGSYLKYKKSALNENYLHEKNKKRILGNIKGIKLLKMLEIYDIEE